MTKNERHALVILCLIVLVMVSSVLVMKVYAHFQNTYNQKNNANTQAEEVLNQEETAEVAADDDSTIETTSPEEMTNTEETTSGSTETTTTTDSSKVVTSKNPTKEETTENATKADSDSQTPTANSYAALTQYNQAILDAINEARNSAGLGSVYLDSRLTNDALIRVCEEATAHEINHVRLDNSECFSVDKGYYTAEILYRGNTTDASVIVNAWLASKKHHDVIMDVNSSHSALGIAFILGDDGLYYCCIGWR